jgi:hypothetical protein
LGVKKMKMQLNALLVRKELNIQVVYDALKTGIANASKEQSLLTTRWCAAFNGEALAKIHPLLRALVIIRWAVDQDQSFH